ncbi:MAG: S41 family peptidase [Clostridia bacterium]|nr:S41 family peptidase [Clostridia bacterium]
MTDNRLRQIYRIACLGLAFLLGALAGVCAFRIVSDKQADDPFKDFSVPAHEESGDYNVYADLMVFNELYKLIETRYAGEFDPDEAMQAALEQYVASLNDPYSVYMTNDQADSFIDGDFGKKVGIGVRIYRMSDMAGMYVYQVLEGSPAKKHGVMVGDIIIGVDGTEVTDENYNAMVDSVSGEEGTTVNLKVLRGEKTLELSVVRGSFIASSIDYKMLESAENVGYVRILSLASDTADSFRDAVKALEKQGAESYIFDVRNNSGGYLSSIIDVLDMLLPKGPIVRYNDASGKETADYSDAATIIKAPMAVLINGASASAAELFSAALKDYKLAVLVGETTFGKGVMQTLFTLPNGDTLKLTTSTYSPPFSENYNGIGVIPDIEVSLPEDKQYYMLSEKEDSQLQAAISALEVKEKQD